MLAFGPFRFDAGQAAVWCGTDALRLSPKACTVLRMLVEQPGQVVSKDTLLEGAWPEVAVSDAVLAVCIGELRRELGDRARAPQFIETVHRRGYRFIAPVTRVDDRRQPHAPGPVAVRERPLVVGREVELGQLHERWRHAQGGTRQVVFVAGDPGTGKTALLHAFLDQLSSDMPLWITWGQCIAHYGSGEGYLPVLDALGQLCQDATDARILDVLTQYAPTWMIHLPAYHSAAELAALQRTVQGATPERMLREIADALEALTAVQPVILLLEDLQWSDMATVDLLAWLARRRQHARLLLVGTYRPVDVIVQQHPLRAVIRELALHALCAELSLGLLNQAEIGQYLSARCGQGRIAETLASMLYWRTEGHPLFLVTLIEMLERQGIAWDTLRDVEAALREVPPSLRGMVAQQLAQCHAAERQVLEAASVAGVAFAAAAMTAGVGETAETIEHRCSTLASRGQFLQESGLETWPDGTVTARYGFRHVLYQQIIYEQIAPGRRWRLHEQIGHQLEAGFGKHVGERAAELAEHFEHGRDYHRAVEYLQQAAQNAARRSAPHEVMALCTKGLTLLDRLPETPARRQQELALHVLLGPALIATQGNADPAVERTYTRAWALCQQIGDTPHIFPVLRGLMLYATNRGEVQRAGHLGEHMLRLAHAQNDQVLRMLAHYMMGVVCYAQGELEAAHTQHLQVLAIYTPEVHRDVAVRYGVDPSVGAHFCLAWELWLLGYPDQALHHNQEALRLAQETYATSSLPAASFYRAVLYHFRREVQRAQRQAEAVIALATEQGLALWLALGTVIHGWAMAMQGQVETGIVELRQGFDATLATGCDLEQTHILGLLAEAYGEGGEPDAGLTLLAEAHALIDATEVRTYEAELWRLKGTLLLKRAGPDASQAEPCFHQALALARRQQAKSWELRAATSLARLWQQQGKQAEAYELLAPIYGWFTEGFDTADLQEAKALLEELGR